MSEPDDLARMLAEYRGSLQPDATDRARVRRAIGAVEDRRAWWRALVWRAGAVAAIAAAALVLAIAWVQRRGVAGDERDRGAPSEAPRAIEGTQPATATEREPAPRAPAPVIEPTSQPEGVAPPAVEMRPRAVPLVRVEPPGAAVDAVRAEAALVERARKALDDGATDDVIALSSEHTRRFPGGVLAVEVGALRALALCTAGKSAQGRGEAQVFLREHPRAPYRDRIRRACGLDEIEEEPR